MGKGGGSVTLLSLLLLLPIIISIIIVIMLFSLLSPPPKMYGSVVFTPVCFFVCEQDIFPRWKKNTTKDNNCSGFYCSRVKSNISEANVKVKVKNSYARYN